MLFLTIIHIILSSASIDKRDFSMLLSKIAVSSLLVILGLNYKTYLFLSLEKGISLYNGLFQCNAITNIFNSFLILLTSVILSLTSFYSRKLSIINTHVDIQEQIATKDFNDSKDTNTYGNKLYTNISDKILFRHRKFLYANNNAVIIDKTNNSLNIPEYSLLILFILCGAILLITTNDIISVFMSIELQSYGLYLLSSVYRNSELSTKAGLTYFLLGGLSSCIILLAQGLLYINSGNTNLENIYVLSNLGQADIFNTQTAITSEFNVTNDLYSEFYINISLVILSVGFLFKVSAAPFHFWSPDVYDGVPTIVTTFIAIIAKISIFVFFLQLVHYTNNRFTVLMTYNWTENLLLSSLLSLIIGTVLGLSQSRLKRLYAYSTISHVGFILLAISINTTESIQAFIFYLLQYSITNLNAFIILIAIGYFFINFYNKDKESDELKEKNNSPIQLISQLKGLYKLNTMLALSFAITIFSFLGVPPLLGFFGKQMIISASLDSGYIFMSLVAILTSVISAVYYLVVIKRVFFDESNNSHTNIANENTVNTVSLSSNLSITISILTLCILVYIFDPLTIIRLVQMCVL